MIVDRRCVSRITGTDRLKITIKLSHRLVLTNGRVLLSAMSRSKGYSGKDASIPADVEWVTIEVTDGDSRRWPTNTTPNPDSEGHVNYMQPLGLDSTFAVKWRLTIGKALAEMHKYPNYSMHLLEIQKQ